MKDFLKKWRGVTQQGRQGELEVAGYNYYPSCHYGYYAKQVFLQLSLLQILGKRISPYHIFVLWNNNWIAIIWERKTQFWLEISSSFFSSGRVLDYSCSRFNESQGGIFSGVKLNFDWRSVSLFLPGRFLGFHSAEPPQVAHWFTQRTQRTTPDTRLA